LRNDSASKPMYEQIFEALRERIRLHEYKIGERVPSEKELCDEFGVSRITTKKALEMLVAQQLVVRQPGRGSFVADLSAFDESSQSVSESSSLGLADKKSERTSAPKRKPLIGLVITHFSDMYGTELVYGMEEASREHDSFLVLRRSFGIPEQEQRNIVELLELGVDGLIIFPAQGEYFSEEILKLVIGKFPFVMIDRFLKGIPASSVSTDNASAAKIGVQHLFDQGHQHIAFLTQPPINTTAIEERIKGIVEAHSERGILVNRDLWVDSLVSTLPNAFDPQDRVNDVNTIVQHLKEHPEITALFAAEYPIALLAEEAAAQLGLRIPEDLSLVCFDSPENPDDIRITHLRQNQFQMGKQAFEMVLELMKSSDQTVQRVELAAELIEGITVSEASSRQIARRS